MEYTDSFKTARRGRLALSVLPVLLTFTAGSAILGAMAPEAKGAKIFVIPSNPKPDDVSDARKELANGTVVEMRNASAAKFSSYFNVGLPQPKQAGATDPNYCAIAAYRDATGLIHTYLGDSLAKGQKAPDCEKNLKTWAEQQTSLKDANPPAAAAWTQLSVTTMTSTSGNKNQLQETLAVYRLNTNDTQTDYYMVTKQTDSQPNFDHCTWGGTCGWFSTSRNLNITLSGLTNGTALFDHGPLAKNNSSTASFNVGIGISASPNASAGYSQSWSQSDVETDDTTQLGSLTASWSDKFDSNFSWSHPPNAIVGLWESDQAAIFTVPAGTTGFAIGVDDSATFGYDHGFGVTPDTASLEYFVLVSPPSLAVTPATIRVVPGQTATFDINANIPNSTGENISWSIGNVPSGVSLNTTTGSGTQTPQLQVPSSTSPGQIGTLNIDTNPRYAAPETRNGPLQIPVIVVSGSSIPSDVLIAGGQDWSGRSMSSVELWDPATQKSTLTSSMSQARAFHTATPLANNEVLIAGGIDDSALVIGTTELFDEATQRFSPGPALQAARAHQTATLLNNGTVLLAGGEDPNGYAVASAEIYDPTSNTTTAVGNMTAARMKHSATKLADGRVLIVGGATSTTDGTGIATAEIYDPSTKTFARAGSLDHTLMDHAATLLSNGQVLITGDQQYSNPVAGSYMYTPSAGTFAFYPTTDTPTTGIPALVALPASSALLVNGLGTSYLWDPHANNYGTQSFYNELRERPVAIPVRYTGTALDNNILVAGGVQPQTGSDNGTLIEVYDVANNSWSGAGNMTTPREGHTLTLFGAVQATTTTTLSATPNPANVGTKVTFTATVKSSGTPTGTVTFFDGTTSLGSVDLENGTATYSTTVLTAGTHQVTAQYGGDANNVASTSSAVSQVISAPMQTPIFSNLTPSQSIAQGTSSISLSGVIGTTNGVYPAQGENIHVTIGNTSSDATVGPDGSFSISNFSTATIPVGAYTITYSYAGNSQFTNARDISTTLTVVASSGPIATTITLRSTVQQCVSGVPFQLFMTVGSSVQDGSITGTIVLSRTNPDGTVTKLPQDITDGTWNPGLNGTNDPLAPGSYSFVANYQGNSNFAPSSSAPLMMTCSAQ